MIPDRWLTEREVSKITGLALATLRNQRYLRKGVPFAKVGKSVRYSLADVTCFMDGCRVEMRETGQGSTPRRLAGKTKPEAVAI